MARRLQLRARGCAHALEGRGELDLSRGVWAVKKNLAFASMIAVTAGAAGVGAFDQVPAMVGADSMKDLTIAILNNCAALHVLGDPIQYDGIGSATGEFALRTIGFGAKQMVAPMSR